MNERLTTNPVSTTPFRAEQVIDYEVGIKSEFFDRRLRVNGDYYRSNYKDIQRTVLVLDPSGRAVTLIQNAARAVIQGVEIEAIAKPVDRLSFQGSFGYTDPKYKKYIDPATGTDLSSQKFKEVSKWSYSISGLYELPTSFGKAGARIDYSWRSDRNLFPTGGLPSIENQPGYALLNGQLQIHVDSVNLDARLFVKNALDKKYFQALFSTFAQIGLTSGIPGEPRTWGLSVTKRF